MVQIDSRSVDRGCGIDSPKGADVVEAFSGGCACGRIRFECSRAPYVVYACHCTICKKRTGSAFAISVQVPSKATRIDGAPTIRVRSSDSGNRVSSYFCGECGSTLYSVSAARPGLISIVGGAIDDPSWLQLEAHIWIESAVPFLSIPEGVPAFRGQGDLMSVLKNRTYSGRSRGPRSGAS